MTADGGDDTAGRRGWALVAAIVASVLALPAVVTFLPAARPSIRALGLTLHDAYLVLPLVPALVLGAVAVWSALRARRE